LVTATDGVEFFEEAQRPKEPPFGLRGLGRLGHRLFPSFARKLTDEQRNELRKELVFCGIDLTPEEYVSATYFLGILTTLFIPPVLAPIVAFMYPDTLVLVLGAVAAGPLMGTMVFRTMRDYPHETLTDYAVGVEAELPNTLRGLALEQTMNIPLKVSLKNLAKEGTGAMSQEAEKILADISRGSSVKDSLARSSERVRSEIYRRAMNQLIAGLERGTPLKDILWSLAKEVDVKANIAMQEYEGKLQALSATYITTAAVVPGITGTIFMIAGPSFMGKEKTIPLTAAVFCFIFPVLNQLMLNSMKEGRPSV